MIKLKKTIEVYVTDGGVEHRSKSGAERELLREKAALTEHLGKVFSHRGREEIIIGLDTYRDTLRKLQGVQEELATLSLMK